MISKEQIKFIKSLHIKKYRQENKLFLVEWKKSLEELLKSDFKIQKLYITKDFLEKNKSLLLNKIYYITDSNYLEKVSTYKTNSDWIAIVEFKENKDFLIKKYETVIVLDEIKDPWNLWTIIRICDWFWIDKIIASNNTVEIYNPKVISSTMWSFCRVKIFYTDLKNYFKDKKNDIYGTFMSWEDVHNIKQFSWWYIFIWNESNWISQNLKNFITKKITIPRFWKTESLNAAIATAIVVDNLMRIKNRG